MQGIEQARTHWVTVTLLALVACGCGDARDQALASSEAGARTNDPVTSAPTAASASAAPVATPAKPQLLKLAKAFPGELKGLGSVYQLNGHLLIIDGQRVVHVAGQKLELIAERTGDGPFGGQAVVSWIGGTYPDAIDMIGHFSNGRAPMPHVGALTGKGNGTAFGGGGGYGHVAGVAYRDGSAMTLGEDWNERRFATIRGKPIALTQTGRLKVGCAAEKDRRGGFVPAVDARVLGSGKDGTIISVGDHCGGPHAGLELWPREGEPKVIEIKEWKADSAYSAHVLSGPDRIWISGSSSDPILELKNGAVRALPKLSRVGIAFVGPDDTLYASDGTTIHHLVGAQDAPVWQPVASLVWPTELQTATLYEGAFWGSADGTVYRFEQGESLELSDGCKSPFVHLFDIKAATEPGYSFPTTKKALAGFERKKEIALVEFSEGNRRLGVKVPDRATGEALIALIKSTMKDEAPRLLCYEPSNVLRTHPLP